MKEIFKDIPEYKGIYQVSNLGRVKSLSRFINNGNGGFISKDKILKLSYSDNYYQKVCLSKNSNQKVISIHKLVALVFLNYNPNNSDKIVVDHINNIKIDNRLENLQLISQRKNCSKDKKGYSSKYIGVYWDKEKRRWRSQITVNGKNIKLGRFDSELAASKAYYNSLMSLTK